MNKDRVYCASYSCLIRTCSRHRCQIPKVYYKPLVWKELEDECDIFVSSDYWKNLDVEDKEDDDDDFI